MRAKIKLSMLEAIETIKALKEKKSLYRLEVNESFLSDDERNLIERKITSIDQIRDKIVKQGNKTWNIHA